MQVIELDITIYLISKPAPKNDSLNLDFKGFGACILRRGVGAGLGRWGWRRRGHRYKSLNSNLKIDSHLPKPSVIPCIVGLSDSICRWI